MPRRRCHGSGLANLTQYEEVRSGNVVIKPSSLRAAIYVRVSTGGQEDNYSPKTQEEACRAYCARHGYEVDEANVYREVFSGADLHARPELRRLRRAAKGGRS